jgi:hypothetical protein
MTASPSDIQSLTGGYLRPRNRNVCHELACHGRFGIADEPFYAGLTNSTHNSPGLTAGKLIGLPFLSASAEFDIRIGFGRAQATQIDKRTR